MDCNFWQEWKLPDLKQINASIKLCTYILHRIPACKPTCNGAVSGNPYSPENLVLGWELPLIHAKVKNRLMQVKLAL